MGLVKVVLGLLVFGVLLAVTGIAAGLWGNRPPLTEPPGPWRRLHVYLTTHVAATSPTSEFPELEPQRYDAPPHEVLAMAADACRTFGWEPVAVDAGSGRVTAVVTSALWQFKDDVTITVEADSNRGSVLNVRSKSRVGRGDLAANANHLRQLFEGMNRRLAPPSS
ncbi:MAG: DUF1499 domain-containing protein [Gammaproteobacteria bacterium]